MAADDREEIRRKTAMLDNLELDESDPFTDVEEDQYELEESELILDDC